MKPYRTLATSAITLVCLLGSPVRADVTLDWVTVTNPYNDPDTNGHGSVDTPYRISKHEITNQQYAAFLNAKAASDPYGLYHAGMAYYGIVRSGTSGAYTYAATPALAQRPVVYVSWFDAARFVNWLANGQGGGDTESGTYALAGAMSGVVAANLSADFRIPSEDQWYKAAFFDPAGPTYTMYAHHGNTLSPTDANYGGNASSTTVGSFTAAASAYGTFDQGGNVWEWNDAVIDTSLRGLRGGSWLDGAANLKATTRGKAMPSFESYAIGFRVAAKVP